jgi:hypothetical protein
LLPVLRQKQIKDKWYSTIAVLANVPIYEDTHVKAKTTIATEIVKEYKNFLELPT